MWQEKDNKLYRAFKFKDFSEAFSFMCRVALLAEKNEPSSHLDKQLEQGGNMA